MSFDKDFESPPSSGLTEIQKATLAEFKKLTPSEQIRSVIQKIEPDLLPQWDNYSADSRRSMLKLPLLLIVSLHKNHVSYRLYFMKAVEQKLL